MIALVDTTDAHFDAIASWFRGGAEIAVWAGPAWTHPLSRKAFAATLVEARAPARLRDCVTAIDRTGGIVGHAQLRLNAEPGVATLTMVAVAPQARGRGIGRAIVGAMIDRAFARPELERLQLRVFTFNAVAARLYASFGFRDEGVARAVVRVGDADWDLATMAIARADRSPAAAAIPKP